jgi:hypothetical protein
MTTPDPTKETEIGALRAELAEVTAELAEATAKLAEVTAELAALRAGLHSEAIARRLEIERYAARWFGHEESFAAMTDRELMLATIERSGVARARAFKLRNDDWVGGTFAAIMSLYPAPTRRRRVPPHGRQHEHLKLVSPSNTRHNAQGEPQP